MGNFSGFWGEFFLEVGGDICSAEPGAQKASDKLGVSPVEEVWTYTWLSTQSMEKQNRKSRANPDIQIIDFLIKAAFQANGCRMIESENSWEASSF